MADEKMEGGTCLATEIVEEVGRGSKIVNCQKTQMVIRNKWANEIEGG